MYLSLPIFLAGTQGDREMGLNVWYKRLNEMLFSTPSSLRPPPLYFAEQNTP